MATIVFLYIIFYASSGQRHGSIFLRVGGDTISPICQHAVFCEPHAPVNCIAWEVCGLPAASVEGCPVVRFVDHLYIFAMLFFSVYSQLIIRWQVSLAGPLPESLEGKLFFVLRLLLSPWVITALAATFLSGISWMLAMTKFEISYAYPWASLNFVFMLAFGVLLFGEHFSLTKLAGTLFVVAGIGILARA